MEITDEVEKERILLKISKIVNIVEYYDLNNLTFDEFLEKYGHWGFSFHNFYEIRFYNTTNVLDQVKKLTSNDSQYYFLPIDIERKVYKGNIDLLDNIYPEDHLKAHIIIADLKLNWLLIKNDFNKLIGIGDIVKRIKKMIHLKFDNEKLMHCDYDNE